MIVKKGDAVVIDQCAEAKKFFERFKGYIGRRSIANNEGLWFPKCNSVHMWWMMVSIDVVFLKKTSDGYIVSSTRENIRPWKFWPVSDFSASDTLELAAGTIARSNIKKGDTLRCTS